jgi:hypothetical protein
LNIDLSLKKIETMEAPQNKNTKILPFWPKYIGERRTTFVKNIWDKSEVLLGTLCFGIDVIA